MVINGVWYHTSEHAYQHRKATVMKDWMLADYILRSDTPQEAKYYGSIVATDSYWNSIKQEVMHKILHEKVKQCPEFSTNFKIVWDKY